MNNMYFNLNYSKAQAYDRLEKFLKDKVSNINPNCKKMSMLKFTDSDFLII